MSAVTVRDVGDAELAGQAPFYEVGQNVTQTPKVWVSANGRPQRAEANAQRLALTGDHFLGAVVRGHAPIDCRGRANAPLTADLQELYAWSAQEAEVDDLGELGPHLEAETLDLRPAVRDGLILEMPPAPLCDLDCPGLCAQCGAKLADDPVNTGFTGNVS